MVGAESPPASLPSRAISAPSKSLVEKPFRRRIGINTSLGVRREAESPTRSGCVQSFADPVAHARAAHGDRTDADHDLAFGQIAVRTSNRQPSADSLSAWRS